jgi:outer membrane protein OmpA-like peptidoglycan-associated protein
MPTFSPYSGKYVGYAIEKGKLSVDIHYHIEKGELRAENDIFLDQLTLGEKIESPDALSIPVNLALSLLKNREGEINVHLPVSGSINDPQFSLGGVIMNAIVNLLTKAVTAPFTLLGSLFEGEELSEISFAPGNAKITPEAENRLKILAKALIDRPSLELEITGRADPAQDADALKHRLLERRVKSQKLAEDVKKGKAVGALRDVELTPDEYPKYLTLAYKDADFAKPKNIIGLTKTLPIPEMEQLLLANINAGDDEMRELAQQRAAVARNWLIEQGGIPGERMFLREPKVEVEVDPKKFGGKVEFSLR